jgi:hypothetical protein
MSVVSSLGRPQDSDDISSPLRLHNPGDQSSTSTGRQQQQQQQQQAALGKSINDVEDSCLTEPVLVFSKWDPDTSDSALLTFSGVMRSASVALSWTSADELISSSHQRWVIDIFFFFFCGQ